MVEGFVVFGRKVATLLEDTKVPMLSPGQETRKNKRCNKLQFQNLLQMAPVCYSAICFFAMCNCGEYLIFLAAVFTFFNKT